MCIIGQEEAEQRWATDASVLRAAARTAYGAPVSDKVLIERHLRKLSKSLAVTRDRNGMIVDCLDKNGRRRPKKHVRVIRYDKRIPGGEVLDWATGELIDVQPRVQHVKKYKIGYYHGGSGFLSVNDGRVTAAALLRLLEQRRNWELTA